MGGPQGAAERAEERRSARAASPLADAAAEGTAEALGGDGSAAEPEAELCVVCLGASCWGTGCI